MFWKTPDSEMLGNVMVQQAISKKWQEYPTKPNIKNIQTELLGKTCVQKCILCTSKKEL